MELITGKNVKELQKDKGLSSLAQLFNPLSGLEPNQVLKSTLSSKLQSIPPEIQAMGRAAYFCLRSDPESRPSMSKVCLFSAYFCILLVSSPSSVDHELRQ